MKLTPMKSSFLSLVIAVLATSLVAWSRSSRNESQRSSYIWVVDKITHKLKKVRAGRGVPTYTHAGFPIEQTTNYKERGDTQGSGCYCGYDPRLTIPPNVVVTPTSIPDAKVGQDITIRYDGSNICRGKTIQNLVGVNSPDPRLPDNPALNLGTADWQAGDLQSLPREWGIITLPGGYSQSGTYTITVSLSVYCVDTGSDNCKQACSTTSVAIPVTVQ
jgi:hypothetical protein